MENNKWKVETFKNITEVEYPQAFKWYTQEIATKNHRIFNNCDIDNPNPLELIINPEQCYENNLILIQKRIIANYKVKKILNR